MLVFHSSYKDNAEAAAVLLPPGSDCLLLSQADPSVYTSDSAAPSPSSWYWPLGEEEEMDLPCVIVSRLSFIFSAAPDARLTATLERIHWLSNPHRLLPSQDDRSRSDHHCGLGHRQHPPLPPLRPGSLLECLHLSPSDLPVPLLVSTVSSSVREPVLTTLRWACAPQGPAPHVLQPSRLHARGWPWSKCIETPPFECAYKIRTSHLQVKQLYTVPLVLKGLSETAQGITDLKRLSKVVSAGSALSDEVGARLAAQDVAIVSLYGSTETGFVRGPASVIQAFC